MMRLQQENPQLAGWINSESQKWFVDVKQAEASVNFANNLPKNNWATELQQLLPAQQTVNGMLEPYVQEYTNAFREIMQQAKANPGKFRREDIENQMAKYVNLKVSEIQSHFQQNPDNVRDLFVKSQGGLEELFYTLLRKYMRQDG